MAFHHLSGVTTPGAANAVNDWFATFEAWIRDVVGWTIAAGAGTDNLRISSIGESGLMTMLFAHIWRTPGTENVRTEVSDDVIPTHETTRGLADLLSADAQFAYWMSADLDAIVIVWKSGSGYWMRYAGLVMPFAQNAPDETYYSISTNGIRFGTVLRNFAGLWDRDDQMYCNDYLLYSGQDHDNGNFYLGGTYFGEEDEIAGQLKHVSTRFLVSPTLPEDTVVSDHPGGSSTWIVLNGGGTFALRTGGTLPPGPPETNFVYATGNAAMIGNWFIALANFMVANGWAAFDLTGLTGNPFDYEFNSQGESGTDDIWVRVLFAAAGPHVIVCIADSAFLTPGRVETTRSELMSWVPGIFPANYYFAGDRDCVVMTIDDGASYAPCWAGKVYPSNHSLSSIYMNYVHMNLGTVVTVSRVLQARDGTWNQHANFNWDGDGNSAANSNPNLYDGTTYLAWPQIVTDPYTTGLGQWHEPIGVLKYFFMSDGGGIAQLDTIQDGAEIYTIFSVPWAAALQYWCMRSDALGPGVNFPGRRLYPNDGNVTMSPMVDAGPLTKVHPTVLERGNVTPDYNIVTKGHATRIDIIPRH